MLRISRLKVHHPVLCNTYVPDPHWPVKPLCRLAISVNVFIRLFISALTGCRLDLSRPRVDSQIGKHIRAATQTTITCAASGKQ